MATWDLKFTRRRYGGRHGTTYTWVAVRSGDQWYDLEDPWPYIQPKRNEILESLSRTLLRHDLPLTGSGPTTGNWSGCKGFATIEAYIPMD